MLETSKLAVIIGCLAKVEASYGAGGALATATDGVVLAELADLFEAFVHDGARAMPPSTMGGQVRVPPSGAYLETTLKTEPRGRGSAYGAALLHPEHTFMRLSGHDAVITSSAGTEKIVYSPTPGPSGFGSGVLGLYSRGSLWSVLAGYMDWSFGADGPSVPLAEWALKALFTSVADTAVPAITYPVPDVQPPAAANIAFSIGGVTSLVVKKYGFKQNRTITNRKDMNGGGHGGFSIGRRSPVFTVTIEEPTVATYDARLKRRTGVLEALSMAVGTVQYNRDKFAAPKAQLVDVKPGAEDTTATLDLTYELKASTLGANDEYTRTVD